MPMKIHRLTLHRVQVPLTVPYKLSLATIRAFDLVLVEALGPEGETGLGEAAIVTGYTPETIDQSWSLACELGGLMVGTSCESAKDSAAAHHARAPFMVSALTTAVEMLEGSPLLRVTENQRVPLLAIMHALEPGKIEAEVERHIADGYGVIKVKVGFDVQPDLERVRRIQRATANRAQLRLDGNQGYSLEEARVFAAALEPEGIELLEQPCAAGDWDAAVAVAGISPVPMMLDESIYDISDVEKAADLGAAAYIKFKLMKAGGLARLGKALERVRECGMEPVLGNGVAGEIGCWMEACIARTHIRNAGEMNGFLKPRAGLLTQGLSVERGALVLEPGFAPRLDPAVVAEYAVDTAHFGE